MGECLPSACRNEQVEIGPCDELLWAAAFRRMHAWDLSEPVELARTKTALVLRVSRRDGTQAVLKCLTEAGKRYESTAPAVLRGFDGRGVAQVLASYHDALLLEYCAGPALLDSENGEADAIAVPVVGEVIAAMQTSQAARPAGVPTLEERCQTLDRVLPSADGELRAILQTGSEVADKLLADHVAPALLHGKRCI